MTITRSATALTHLALLPALLVPVAGQDDHPPIPIRFETPEPGFVTLAIDDADGRRVGNLLSETPFGAGEHTV